MEKFISLGIYVMGLTLGVFAVARGDTQLAIMGAALMIIGGMKIFP